MSDSDSGTVIPEDEFQAALGEIEKLGDRDGGDGAGADKDNTEVGPAAAEELEQPAPAIEAADTSSPESEVSVGDAPASDGERGDQASAAAHPNAGDTSVSNAILSENELDAAFAEISQLSADDVPSLDDGKASAAIPELEIDAALDELEQAATEFDDGADGLPEVGNSAETQHSRAGDTSVSNAILSDDELSAALSEISEESDSVPSLDDGGRPAEIPAADTSVGADSGASGAVADSAPPPTNVEADGDSTDATGEEPESQEPPKRGIRFKIGKKNKDAAEEEKVEEYRPPAPREQESASGSAKPPMPSRYKRAYRLLDELLDAINRPFVKLDKRWRDMIGYAALATVVVSLLAMALLPVALPRRDAITFVEQQVAKLENPQPAEKPETQGSDADQKAAEAD